MTARRMTCDRCHDVIGIYEPVVIVVDGEARETSRAAEPAIVAKATERYHRSCHRASPAAPVS
jgi:hypothetical protein